MGCNLYFATDVLRNHLWCPAEHRQEDLRDAQYVCPYPARKDQALSLGWDNQPQLNHFQLKQHKNKEVTAKITTQTIIQGQQDLIPQRTPYDLQQKDCTPFSIQINASSMRTPTSLSSNSRNSWSSTNNTEDRCPPAAPSRRPPPKTREELPSDPAKTWRTSYTTEWA